MHEGQVLLHLDLELHASASGHRGLRPLGVGDDDIECRRVEVDPIALRFERQKIGQFVHELGEGGGLAGDDLVVLASRGRCDGIAILQEHLGVRENAGQRGAHLVIHGGENDALHPVEVHEPPIGVLELERMALQRGKLGDPVDDGSELSAELTEGADLLGEEIVAPGEADEQ